MLPYRNAELPPEARVADLLARMTVDEKAAQMMCVWQKKADTLVDEHGNFDIGKARGAFAHGNGIGQVGRPSDAGGSGHEPDKGRNARQQAQLTNDIQRFFVEESRLGIPVVFHDECLHGHAAIGGTSFAQPVTVSIKYDPSKLAVVGLRQSRGDGTERDGRALVVSRRWRCGKGDMPGSGEWR